MGFVHGLFFKLQPLFWSTVNTTLKTTTLLFFKCHARYVEWLLLSFPWGLISDPPEI
jgi:hypothetical protein